jgi:hypothetical protein
VKLNKQHSNYSPYPENNTISNLESEVLEEGDHEILVNSEKNQDKPVITKKNTRIHDNIPVTSPHSQENIIPVTVYKKNNIKPSYQPNFRLSPRQVDWLTSEVKRLEREDKIVKTNSPFNSPLNLVAKDKTWRFTESGERLNRVRFIPSPVDHSKTKAIDKIQILLQGRPEQWVLERSYYTRISGDISL